MVKHLLMMEIFADGRSTAFSWYSWRRAAQSNNRPEHFTPCGWDLHRTMPDPIFQQRMSYPTT
jgi:hypothetical protein